MKLIFAVLYLYVSYERWALHVVIKRKVFFTFINYKVAKGKRTPGSSFKIVLQQRFQMNENTYSARNEMLYKSLFNGVATCKIHIYKKKDR